MAEGRSHAEWGRTSSLMALVANVNRDPKKRRRPFTPSEFNPHIAGRRRRGVPVSVDRLADEMVRVGQAKGRRRRDNTGR